MSRGGAIIDFYLPSLGMAINVQSTYWHYNRPENLLNDKLQRAALEGAGLVVIYIDEEDALSNPFYYVDEALRGIDQSRVV